MAFVPDLGVVNVKWSDATSVSVSASVNSDSFQVGENNVGVVIVRSSATAAVVGTLTLEASNDNSNFVSTGTTDSVTSATAAANYILKYENAPFNWYRVAWTHTSGGAGGTMGAKVNGKG